MLTHQCSGGWVFSEVDSKTQLLEQHKDTVTNPSAWLWAWISGAARANSLTVPHWSLWREEGVLHDPYLCVLCGRIERERRLSFKGRHPGQEARQEFPHHEALPRGGWTRPGPQAKGVNKGEGKKHTMCSQQRDNKFHLIPLKTVIHHHFPIRKFYVSSSFYVSSASRWKWNS